YTFLAIKDWAGRVQVNAQRKDRRHQTQNQHTNNPTEKVQPLLPEKVERRYAALRLQSHIPLITHMLYRNLTGTALIDHFHRHHRYTKLCCISGLFKKTWIRAILKRDNNHVYHVVIHQIVQCISITQNGQALMRSSLL